MNRKSGTYTKMPLNFEDLMSFIKTIPNPEYRLMVAIGTCAFMRVGEVVAVRRKDIGRDTITVRKTKCRTGADGRKKNPFEVMPIPPWLQEMASEVLPLLKRSHNEPVFQRMRGGGGLDVGGANKRLRTIFEGVDVGDQIPTFHMLRKTAAVEFYRSCGNLHMVQKALRHASIGTTGIYVNTGQAAFESAYNQAFS